MNSNIVEIFTSVQNRPYKVCKFEEEMVNENLKEGDCRHKSLLLYNKLKEKKFKVKKIKVIFNWKDLPIPKEILSILTAGTLWDHNSLAVNIGKKWINVDCVWDQPLKKICFPITLNWDGKSNTKQITEGKLKFYDAEEYIRDKTKIIIVKEEALEFADQLNKFLEKAR